MNRACCKRCCTCTYLHICFCLERSGHRGHAAYGLYTAHHSNNNLTTHTCPCHHAAHEKEYPQICPQAFLPHPPPSWQVQGMSGDPAATCASLKGCKAMDLQVCTLSTWPCGLPSSSNAPVQFCMSVVLSCSLCTSLAANEGNAFSPAEVSLRLPPP